MLKSIGAAIVAMTLLSTATVVRAADFQPALIFDMGGKFDASFNEAAYHGAEKFKQDTGISYLEFEITNESQREQALSRMARRGANIVVMAGFSFATPLETLADQYPDTKFVIIDAVVDKPNVESIVFKEQEGSFLVGMAAALASKTGTTGFVGGMDIPLIRNFQVGYEEGVHYVKPDDKVLVNYAGDTAAAWSDPAKGNELAISQFDRGADVVYHAAGATGRGVLQAAADRGKLGIGVDSNQNGLYPGHVLTSMVKRVDVAVYEAFKEAQGDGWKPGTRVLGLREDGVGYAVDDHNASILTTDMRQKLEAAKAEIIAGKIVVKGYQPN
ncbi:nucleoside-binding protein [Arboricoccus pini]|uniref:Nucleoside-binding protein n=1 Tax=Arboricoccus pini TaxID=1963835 RepID=A0A212QTG3_9PROT|nr:nucleoside-binding protein [Arboricoccus pini]